MEVGDARDEGVAEGWWVRRRWAYVDGKRGEWEWWSG